MAPIKPTHTDGDSPANPVDLTGVTSGRVTKPGGTPKKKAPGTPKKKKTPKLTAPPATHGTACQACRKGKARCVRVTACERCLRAGVPCPAEADGPTATEDVLLGFSKACERCRRLKAACVRKEKCVKCERKGIECVIAPGKGPNVKQEEQEEQEEQEVLEEA
ncbi:hypothetical protein C8A05DRAFT_32441 [Staphylotrichum tortipilum]|uniref:Zn(2)-C6 fungal-type domain-containing protein n=1 Tax=Staphylotrichum tortipilum TaxID=2831512 RepID=A0AAN6MPS8_9PEZI|nr:hypothetical protein C8A05DRAFT_32441 [Staphylotrichum longicolle]